MIEGTLLVPYYLFVYLFVSPPLRLCCGVARPEVQLVTHLCYSDFQDIMTAVDNMDADVLTIENSRSGNEMVLALAAAKYGKDIGPGVYDVHSPVVPTTAWIEGKVKSFIDTGLLNGAYDRIWVNPDCGLKTRRWQEVVPSLKNMVAAAAAMRAAVTGGKVPAAGEVPVAAAVARQPCTTGCC
jgi:5-methyltetrahydropteroyltriglutamate--homocysteine methyltransferase